MVLKAALVSICAAVFALPASAEEGMWTFDNVPLARINKTYNLKLDKAWLDRVQAAAVRLNVGCSASIVSPQGLVFTNHHCIAECAQDLSSPAQDYLANGFLAAVREEEKACPGVVAEVLLSITDYTRDVKAATRGLKGAAFVGAQDARGAAIESQVCGNDRTLRCQMISLYQGGEYKLYKYRRYSDVRLVFAPEFQAAFFGGDPDNFNFPRYALDVAFLRVYDNGRPAVTPTFLKWNATPPKDGEPTFIAGNPGKTQRLMTVSQLEMLRDVNLPVTQAMRAELRGRLIAFSEQSDENRRIAADPLFDVENAFKAYNGQAMALRDPALFAAKAREEGALKKSLKGAFKTEIGDPWADMARSQRASAELFLPYYFLEMAPESSTLLWTARSLVRGAAERAKPSDQRLPEYTDSRLPLTEQMLMSPAPIDKPLEALTLGFRLSKAREYLTADAPQTKLLLGKESPEHLAQTLVDGTQLQDIRVRRALWDGGLPAIQASSDPMVRYALGIDGAARAVRRQYDAEVTGPAKIAAEKIARVRFRAYGRSTYPDATFSLRLSYGKVAGWTYNGTTVTPFTNMKGLYDRATGQQPFLLDRHFAAAQGRFDGDTVFNYVTTNDISGGSSGSPVLNAKGEVIGTAFDGNIHSLGGAYSYNEKLNRTVVVSTAAVAVALDKVYGAQAVLRELTDN